jgi:hypothetical protein
VEFLIINDKLSPSYKTNSKGGQIVTKICSVASCWEVYTLSTETSCEIVQFMNELPLQCCAFNFPLNHQVYIPILEIHGNKLGFPTFFGMSSCVSSSTAPGMKIHYLFIQSGDFK